MSHRPILGESPAVKQLLAMIAKVAPVKTNVLITGESGTGKELVARQIHEQSPLKGKPFVAVNCGAIPATLIESELFGHKKGSFTGAVADKPGLFEVANGGTIFLDEIGELPIGMQVKILRALQERTIRRVGGNEDVRVDARVIAATNRDLEAAIAKGTFREDLYYRLNVIQIKTPPLRERDGDVILLAKSFLTRFGKRGGRELKEFDSLALKALQAYAWPGNVRELENTIERAATLENGPRISLSVFPPAVQAALPAGSTADAETESGGSAGHQISVVPGVGIVLPAPDFSGGPIDFDALFEAAGRLYADAALAHFSGDKKEAAKAMGVTQKQFAAWLPKKAKK